MYLIKYKDKYRAIEQYKDPSGKWRQVSVVIDRDTPQARKKAAATLAAKIPTTAPGTTYKSLVADYINYQKATVKESTWIRNEASLLRLVDVFGDASLESMNARFISSRLLKKTQDPGTYNEYLKRVKAMFHWAYRNDYISSPACVDKIAPLKDSTPAEKVADKYLESDELKKILAAASDYYSPIFEFLALSGLRIGELIALDDADVTDKEIIVNKTYVHQTGAITTPKTATSNRRVFIQPELRSSIQRIRKNTRIYSLADGSRSPYFVVNPSGGRLSYVSAETTYKALCKRVIGRPLSLHSLRHTHVALMAAAGIDLPMLSRRLGHSGTKVTAKIYYHVTKKQREKDNAAFQSVQLLG